MVSLGNNRSHSGGYFGFSEDGPTINSTNSDDDLIIDHIELVSGPDMAHKPIRTTWAIVLAKILYIALGVMAYVIPVICSDTKCGNENPISVTMYIHGGMWFILFLIDRFLQQKHDESRLNGYLDFYRKTRNIRRMPFMINSCANAVMLIVVKVLDNYCHTGKDNKECQFLSKTHYVQILVSVECVIAIIVLIIYLVHTVRFNNKQALPDVNQDELMTSFVNSHSSADIGYRNENYIDQVMEKQADMIRYLKQHTEMLAKRNLTLQEEVKRMKGLRRDGTINGNF